LKNKRGFRESLESKAKENSRKKPEKKVKGRRFREED